MLPSGRCASRSSRRSSRTPRIQIPSPSNVSEQLELGRRVAHGQPTYSDWCIDSSSIEPANIYERTHHCPQKARASKEALRAAVEIARGIAQNIVQTQNEVQESTVPQSRHRKCASPVIIEYESATSENVITHGSSTGTVSLIIGPTLSSLPDSYVVARIDLYLGAQPQLAKAVRLERAALPRCSTTHLCPRSEYLD